MHKKTPIDTGGLPYEIIFVLQKYYILTTNIDVSDGLANGAVGQLVHNEENENQIIRVWLTFNDNRIGKKLSRKSLGYKQQNNILNNSVPINRRNSTIPLNNNKSMFAKRNHFPLISGCSMTIHKCQGGTFQEIVYEYEKKHSQQLLYVALSRVTAIENLFIISKHGDNVFYHGRKEPESLRSLKAEFQRLSLNSLISLENELIDFIKQPGLSIYSLNVQSLRSHSSDLIDDIFKNCNIIILTETWLSNDETVPIDNFTFISKYKRQNKRAAGVAILHNNSDTSHVVTPSPSFLQHSQANDIGDTCFAEYKLNNNQTLLLVAIYTYITQYKNQ